MSLETKIIKKIERITGSQHCTTAREDLACYAYDATVKDHLPDAVVFPGNAREVADIVKLANQEEFNIVPRGAGSGMTGGAVAVAGGVVMVMSRLDRIAEIDIENLVVEVEPGVVTGRLHAAVEKAGLFYPPDPSSLAFSTIGGNLAECAGGPRAVKYGVTRDYVLGLEVVLPTGEVIQTGVRTVKGVVGYDLTRLFIGSEGTLGIITRAVLRLIPLPESVGTMTAFFDDITIAAETVSEIIRRRVVPRTIEFMDHASIQCTRDYAKIDIPEGTEAMLLIEVDGTEDEVTALLRRLTSLCTATGAIGTQMARDKQETENLWKARKSISPALTQFGPDKINEDIVVPRSKIPEMVKKIESLRKETGLTMVSFGHAGDGNIHFNIMLDKRNTDALGKAERATEAVFDHTLKLGGTISGEHGIGTTKAAFLPKEIGAVELDLMKRLKNLLDPKGILNPGKIFSDG
jgi:glycolate oxidase